MKTLLQFSMLLMAAISLGQTPIYQFNFDGNLNNTGSATVLTAFSPSGAVFYVADRFGVANKAFNSSTQLTGAILPALPIGSAPRSVNVWVKFGSNTANFRHNLIGWGILGGGLESAFALSQSGTTAAFFTGPTGANISNAINLTSWYMYTYTYDGTTLKHYINGILKSSVVRSISTLAGSSGNRLSIGRAVNDSAFRMADYSMDDANIYDIALTQVQITALYNATLSAENYASNNLQFSIFPNPANDVLNIEINGAVKSVEIYSLQGQKVMSSPEKQVNITNISNGVYLVRVEDENGAISTQKLVIK